MLTRLSPRHQWGNQELLIIHVCSPALCVVVQLCGDTEPQSFLQRKPGDCAGARATLATALPPSQPPIPTVGLRLCDTAPTPTGTPQDGAKLLPRLSYSCPEVDATAGQLQPQNRPHFHMTPEAQGTRPAPAVPCSHLDRSSGRGVPARAPPTHAGDPWLSEPLEMTDGEREV